MMATFNKKMKESETIVKSRVLVRSLRRSVVEIEAVGSILVFGDVMEVFSTTFLKIMSGDSSLSRDLSISTSARSRESSLLDLFFFISKVIIVRAVLRRNGSFGLTMLRCDLKQLFYTIPNESFKW